VSGCLKWFAGFYYYAKMTPVETQAMADRHGSCPHQPQNGKRFAAVGVPTNRKWEFIFKQHLNAVVIILSFIE
jgi:hypothetical protein